MANSGVTTCALLTCLQDTVTLHAHASGDGGGAPGRCCRLCGGDVSLRSIGDTYFWEGVEERYDKLLYDCFGVRVFPSDCMICDRCINQLRSTKRFKTLVLAALDEPTSEASTTHIIPIERDNVTKSVSKTGKEILDLLKTRISEKPKRRDVRKKIVHVDKDTGGKRVYIQCEMCRQRYPMIMRTEGFKKFVCSRCKKNSDIKSVVCRKCNIGMPFCMMKEHMELHVKADLRGKARLLDRQSKKASKRINSVSKGRVPSKYTVVQNLLKHVRSAHCDNADTVAMNAINCQSRRKLEEHLYTQSLAASHSRLPRYSNWHDCSPY